MMKSFKPKKKLPAVRKCSVMNGNVKTFGKAYNDIKLAGKGSNLLERTSDFSDESSLSDSSSVTYENEVSKAGNTRVLYLPMLVNKIKAIAFEHELLVKMHEIFSEAAKLLEVYVALRDTVN
uniref:Ankyrin 6 n=1 Tax=Microplitis similis bracovirus TaxID=2487141 RepID=A0A3G4R8S4_9VIRU|nr:ankyrin 6 [Microplitis similis bracovirus]